MKRKVNSKGRKTQLSASRLKTRRLSKTVARKKSRPMKAKRKLKRVSKAKGSSAAAAKKIVRIMGQGQFTVDARTLKKLNDLDNSIVELVSQERSDDAAFKEKLIQLSQMVVNNGRPLDPKAILQSDIILPSADLSIDEAKRLFRGEGVIPEI